MMSAIRISLQLATLACIVSIVLSEGCNSCRGSTVSSDSGGEYGVDVSTAVNSKQFQCLKRCGYEYVIILAYENGFVDKNVVSNLANAGDVDFLSVEVYMYPAPMLKSAAAHVNEIVTALQGSDYDTLWIAVESGSWYENRTQNQQFFLELLEEFEKENSRIGVYASGEWNFVMGRNFTEGSHLPIWYQNDDGVPSFDGYFPFGGWIDPSVKQINLEFKVCATPINENWRLEWSDF